MSPDNNHKYVPVVLIILLLMLVAGIVGWRFGHTNKTSVSDNNVKLANSASTLSSSIDVKSLISYTLPDSWQEASCQNAANKLFIIPNGTSLNCNSDPSAPIKVLLDTQNITDCQQLENVPNVRKHVCISMYINGHKTIKAMTEYAKTSGTDAYTAISDYYINTGKGVAKFEYTYMSNNDYQNGFDQLATSVKVK